MSEGRVTESRVRDSEGEGLVVGKGVVDSLVVGIEQVA